MNIWIKQATVLPMNIEGNDAKYFIADVVVAGNKIAYIGDDGAAMADNSFRVIDGRGKVVMPGLINTHTHVSMTLMRSYADDIPLMEWINNYIWPVEANLDFEDVYWGAMLGMAEMILGGTTTIVDMYWWSSAIGKAAEHSGMRAILAPSLIGDKFEDNAREVFDKYGHGEHSRISLMASAHAPYSCNPKIIEKVVDLASKYNTPINIHLSETSNETKIMSDTYGKTSTEYLRDLGVLEHKSLFAHGVHLTDSDLEILSKHDVSISHCPQSNMKLSSGTCRVGKIADSGINVTIATDGACSNNDSDMWDEMRSAAFLQKLSSGDPCTLPCYDVLKMVTVNGAKAIGRDDLGTIEVGKTADLILLDLHKPHFYPSDNLISNLVNCANAADVDTVIVDGEVLMEGRVFASMDLERIYAEIEQRRNRLRSKM